MRNVLIRVMMLLLIGMASCHSGGDGNVLLSRDFTAKGWERFDFITCEMTVKQPVTYDLVMEATFAPSYPYEELAVVFSVFDADDNPLRSRSYRFRLKDKDGQWKSELKDGAYTFKLPINSELSLTDPGTYRFQLENRMPITPLEGIKKVAIIKQ